MQGVNSFNKHFSKLMWVKNFVNIKSGNTFKILIFTFVVLTVLLRPYAAYCISTRADVSANPAKVYNLLQRLIKKKDDHHNVAEHEFSLVQPSKKDFVIPVVLQLFFCSLSFLSIVSLKRYWEANKVFRVFTGNNYYKLISRFQV